MAQSIGQVYYDVLPDLSGFAARVAAGVGVQKPVNVKVNADTKGAQAGITSLTGSSSKLEAAQRRLASAQGALRVSNARLAETTSKAAAGSARLISAEEGQARATRALTAAQQGLAAAEAKVAAEADQASRKTSGFLKNLDSPATQKIGTGLLAAGAGLAVAVGAAVKVTADFDVAVSHVASTGQEAKVRISELRKEAIKYGADTAFSATEAANAQEELIKANVSVSDTINGGLQGALNLAAAGSLEVADAAGIMATAMSQFKLPGEQATHVADLLAAGAGKAQGEVRDFAQALKYVGPVAKGSNISIEETVGTIAELANEGILADQAGTSLRGMLSSLQGPSLKAANLMGDLGIEVYKANGQFVGFRGVAEQLHQGLSGLSEAERDAALSTIFGNAQLTAARVLYNGGAADVDKWTKAVSDSGFAQRTAQTKMDNLRGDLEKLSGAFQSAAITSAQSSGGPLRSIVQAATGAVDAYTNMSDAAKSFAFTGVGVAASAALGVGGFIKIAGAAKGALDTVRTLNISMKTAALGGGAIGIGLAVTVGVLGHYAIESAKAKQRTDDLASALEASKGAIDGNIASLRAQTLEQSGALKAAQQLGISAEDLARASLGQADAVDRVNAALEAQRAKTGYAISGAQGVGASYNELGIQIGIVQEALGDGNRELTTAQEKYDRVAAATKAAEGGLAGAGAAGQVAAAGIDDSGDAAAAAAKKQQDLNEQLNATIKNFTILREGALDQERANQAWRASQDDLTDSVKKNGRSLSNNTEKGQANRNAVIGQITALNDKVTADTKSTAKTKGSEVALKDARRATLRGTEAIRDHARKAGLDKDAVDALIKKLVKVPEKVKTDLSFKTNAGKVLKSLTITTGSRSGNGSENSGGGGSAGRKDGGPVPKRADGGYIAPGPGRGGPRDDLVAGIDRATGRHIVDVSPTEYVVNAKATQKNLPLLKAINSGQQVHYGGLKDGGYMGPETKRKLLAVGPYARDFAINASRYAAQRYQKNTVATLKEAIRLREEMSGDGPVAGGSYAKALTFARRQHGKPYIWASAGPRGYDCSGFQSAIQNVIEGKSNPYSRRYSTGSFAGGPARLSGMTKNKRSPYMIGVRPTAGSRIGHVSGTLNGVNVESTGDHVRVGKNARSYKSGMFTYRYGRARGGLVGDPAFDYLDPQGRDYDPALRRYVLARKNLPGFKDGGVATRAGWATVGERGKEDVYLPKGSEVYPRDRQRPQNVTINIDLGDGVTKRVQGMIDDQGVFQANLAAMSGRYGG